MLLKSNRITICVVSTLLLLPILNSCTNNESQNNIGTNSTIASHHNLDTVNAKKWLAQQLQLIVDNKVDLTSHWQKITTPTYYEFKQDAYNIGWEGRSNMSENDFFNKWKGQYNVEHVKIGTPFFMETDDWSSIKIQNIQVLESDTNSVWLAVTLSEGTIHHQQTIHFQLIQNNTEWLINDINENVSL